MNTVKNIALVVGASIALTSNIASANKGVGFGYSSYFENLWGNYQDTGYAHGNQAKRKEIKYFGSIDVVPSSNGVKTRQTVQGKAFVDRNRNGKMDRYERGLPGVMVSNGYDVVKTDYRGNYTLPAASQGLTNFTVFITKPDGFEVPVNQDYVPQFSYHHQPDGSPELRFGGLAATGAQPEAINFPVIRSQKKNSFKIAVSGDPQPYSNNEVGYVRDTLANELAQRDDLDMVIVEGDIMGDDLGLYPRFKKILSVAQIPMYFVAGNHDLDLDATDDAHSFDTFKREFGPTYYSMDVGNVHFVVLDNVRYPCTTELDNQDGKHNFCDNPERPTYNGVIDAAQVEWLENDLAHVPYDKLIVINLHVPLVSFVDQSSTKHQTDNTQWLYDLIGDRPALALSGHTHTLETFLPGESFAGWETSLGLGATPFPQIITGATSGSWWGGDLDRYNLPMAIQRLGGPKGYLVFEFFGNEFSSKFKAASLASEKQMSMDFLTPDFVEWFEALKAWKNADPETRTELPTYNVHDLADTGILTHSNIAEGTNLMINIWNGSRDALVTAKLDDRPAVIVRRTQDDNGEGKVPALDPSALKKQMYIFRYANKSASGNERAQGFEKWNAAKFGGDNADPQPGDGWTWTQNSNHLWSYPVPADIEDGIHTITITTEDIYGNTYTETKTFEVMAERPAPFFRKEVFNNSTE